MSTPPPPGQPFSAYPPPPARSGIPKWAIVLIIVSLVVFVALPVVALVLAGLGLFHLIKPPEASDTPPKPDFQGYDVCSLITPRDAEQAGARLINFGPEEVTVIGRVVTTTEAGVPVDTCEYGTEPTLGANVKVRVSPAADLSVDELEEGRRVPVPGLGDEAYQVYGKYYGFKLIVRHGTTQLTIETSDPLDAKKDPDKVNDHVKLVTDLGRKAIGKVPAKLTLPATVATGPCKPVDAKKVASALGGPVTYSRSLDSEHFTVCSYTDAQGHSVVLRLEKEIDDSDRELEGKLGDPITIGDYKGYQLLGGITLLGKEEKLAVDYTGVGAGQLTESQVALAGAAADALLD